MNEKQNNNLGSYSAGSEAVNRKTISERLIGILLGLLLIPAIAINVIFLNPNVLYAPVAILMMIYAFFAKRRHPILESFFLIWTFLILFMLGGRFFILRSIIILVKYTPTIFDPNPRLILYILPLVSMIGGLFFILRNIAVRLHYKFNLSMTLLNSLLFLIILISLSTPLFTGFSPMVGNAYSFAIGGVSNSQLFVVGPDTNKNATLSFDEENQTWSVKINLENKNSKSIAVKALYLNKNKIDFNSDAISLDNLLIDEEFLVITPGSKGTITIDSKEPIFRIFLEEDNGFIGGFEF